MVIVRGAADGSTVVDVVPDCGAVDLVVELGSGDWVVSGAVGLLDDSECD